MKSIMLKDLERGLLTTLARLKYATQAQLAYWCGTQVPAVSKTLAALQENGLVNAEKQVQPYIWRLTRAGADRLNKPMPAGRRHASWSVMAHACHANQVEIELRQNHNDFRFFERLTLLKQGFHPSHGEHAGVDGNNTSMFVLVDDFYMQSERIRHHWKRDHRPSKKYWPHDKGRKWHEVMQRFIVACTDPKQMDVHADWLARQDLPVDVMHVKALWR